MDLPVRQKQNLDTESRLVVAKEDGWVGRAGPGVWG